MRRMSSSGRLRNGENSSATGLAIGGLTTALCDRHPSNSKMDSKMDSKMRLRVSISKGKIMDRRSCKGVKPLSILHG